MNAKALIELALSTWMMSACLTGCGGERAASSRVPQEPTSVASPSYDVHEWGLVRGTRDDRIALSGPHAQPVVPPVALPMAKPVLYFHRVGEGPLSIDVRVQIPRGRIVEHWPLDPSATAASIAWRGISIEEGTCPGTRYASGNELPCLTLAPGDACETTELAVVETDDSDCLRTSDGLTWNHLFYRGEVLDAPDLPLRVSHVSFTGRLRVVNEGDASIPGQLIRVRHGDVPEAALAAAPPEPGQEVFLSFPEGPLEDAALSLSASLQAAGLTEAEAVAFRRAWDSALFGSPEAAAWESGASSVGRRRTSLIYVLPVSAADSLSTLRFEPAPRSIRRVLVAWIDAGFGPVERYPRPSLRSGSQSPR